MFKCALVHQIYLQHLFCRTDNKCNIQLQILNADNAVYRLNVIIYDLLFCRSHNADIKCALGEGGIHFVVRCLRDWLVHLVVNMLIKVCVSIFVF